MSNDNSSGDFMRAMDNATYLARTLALTAIVTIWLVMTAIPYLMYRNVADAVTRAVTSDKVWVCEQNQAITWGLLEPPFAFASSEEDTPARRYYTCVGSVQEAENWLLHHGYHKTTLKTFHFGEVWPEKEFFIRHIPGTSAYSIVGLMIDYGDHDIHYVPYRYALGDSPVDFSRFKKETFEKTYGRENTSMILPPWCSTDDVYFLHTLGGTCSPNPHSDGEVEKWARKIAVPPQPPLPIR
jgi:hypothetical protein